MPDSLVVAVITVATFIAMAMNWLRPPIAIWAALHVLIVGGWVAPETALAGFANPALHTIALLLAISEGVRSSGALSAVSRMFLGQSGGEDRVRWRMMSRVAFMSAFLNNTPVVALLLPAVRKWCGEHDVSPSKMLIPLSYAAILGGSCTLIGTSTNLVVLSLLPHDVASGFRMFTLTPVALPAALAGLACTALMARKVLRARGPSDSVFGDPRRFLTEVEIEAAGPLDGQLLGSILVNDQQGLHPAEIAREGRTIVAPHSGFRLRGGDRLRLAGPASQMLEMTNIAGLQPVTGDVAPRSNPVAGLVAVEAVIPSGSALVGKRVGEGTFRRRYGGAVLAVARRGETIAPRGVAGWALQPGDILLIEAEPVFTERYRRSRDLIVLSELDTPAHAPGWHVPAALATVTAMVGVAAADLLTTFQAAAAALLVMFALRICRWQRTLQSLDISTLLTIAAALGLAGAVHETGLDGVVVDVVSQVCDGPSLAVLLLLFVATLVCTELVTNSAAAALMVPLALAIAQRHGIDPMTYVMTVAMAACSSFMTPMGYQTNLLVLGPGRYRFGDFARAGLPVSICVALVTLSVVPLIWPFP